MNNDWVLAAKSLSNISVTSNRNNEPVSISGSPDDLRCIGVGTDAAVFQSVAIPSYAFKVYASAKLDKVQIEEKVYHKLGESPYFSKCFASTENYLVLSYEEGLTLYDCLLQGVQIPEQVILDVEDARTYAINKGLNPRDIHLKNIILQNDRAKILDVSEYTKPGNDFRWEHLRKAYFEYYHLIDGKSVPSWLLETVRKWYNQRNNQFSTFDEFMKNVLKLIKFIK
ncbi:serine/threonine protein kinase [Halalkalibacter urbisdiaboli]|uniref:serine/threonine protein kinase n=1 Tax=Halalkalibacter urbisdiaboli TaxID=1960589 RepID=UPI000B43EB47|nr:serine/threonine protein kinase [Halalkalibacter urbisdiaboli]